MVGVKHVNADGTCIDVTSGTGKILGTVTNGVYTPKVSATAAETTATPETDTGSANSQFTDDEIVEFFNATEKSKGSEHYDAWCTYGRKFADLLIGYTGSDFIDVRY